jgi:hypothetical protein
MSIAYRCIAYLGLFSLFAALLLGFRYDPTASTINYLINILLYGVFAVPHLIMTTPAFKQRMWGNPAGNLKERQFYILVTVITWVGRRTPPRCGSHSLAPAVF